MYLNFLHFWGNIYYVHILHSTYWWNKKGRCYCQNLNKSDLVFSECFKYKMYKIWIANRIPRSCPEFIWLVYIQHVKVGRFGQCSGLFTYQEVFYFCTRKLYLVMTNWAKLYQSFCIRKLYNLLGNSSINSN